MDVVNRLTRFDMVEVVSDARERFALTRRWLGRQCKQKSSQVVLNSLNPPFKESNNIAAGKKMKVCKGIQE